ncbi:unnamed protein product [Parnassius apollo]|uniref:(apollo) hypothetical protein n=1 Tax=Parnassius apollo TaxID=110799 RepID=A0A8S3Y4F0_PARAO|nr:unnamed protein product [Parnassius apollo]
MLWDSKDPDHLNKIKREDCWRKISKQMKLPIPELKKKLDSTYDQKQGNITGSEQSFSTTRTITTTYAIATTTRAIPTRTHAIPTRTHAIATRTIATATTTIAIATTIAKEKTAEYECTK